MSSHPKRTLFDQSDGSSAVLDLPSGFDPLSSEPYFEPSDDATDYGQEGGEHESDRPDLDAGGKSTGDSLVSRSKREPWCVTDRDSASRNGQPARSETDPSSSERSDIDRGRLDRRATPSALSRENLPATVELDGTDRSGDPAAGLIGGERPVRRVRRSSSSTDTSLSLLGRVQNPQIDDDAWGLLADLYGNIVLGWLRMQKLQSDDAYDVLQEVFRRVHGSVHKFERRRSGSFRAWLWTITLNEVRRLHSDRKGRPYAIGGSDINMVVHAVADGLAADPIADDLIIEGLGEGEHAEPDPRHSAAQVMRNALDLVEPEFKPEAWQCFWRMMIDGQSAAEIAADLGISEGNVRTRKHRVLKRLRFLLQGMEVFPDDECGDDCDCGCDCDEVGDE